MSTNKRTLDYRTVELLVHWLNIAARKLDDDVKDRHALAAHLRNGGTFPMWAEGEDGAVAAEGLALNAVEQIDGINRLIDLLDMAEAVEITV